LRPRFGSINETSDGRASRSIREPAGFLARNGRSTATEGRARWDAVQKRSRVRRTATDRSRNFRRQSQFFDRRWRAAHAARSLAGTGSEDVVDTRKAALISPMGSNRNLLNPARWEILIAEGNGERCGQLAQSMRELGAGDVAQVYSLAAAVERLRHQTVDILICGEQLLDHPAAVLVDAARTISPATRTLLIPDDDGRDGVDRAPFAGPTRAATRALLEVTLKNVQPPEGFWCRVPDLSLPDILQLYHQLRRSVTVLVSGPIAGRIRLERGELVHAESDDWLGVSALSRLLATDSGLVRTDLSAFDGTQTIFAPFHRALLDAMDQLDARQPVPRTERLSDLEDADLDEQLISEHLLLPLTLEPSIARPMTDAATRPRPRKVLLIAVGVLAVSTLIAALATRLGTRDERAIEGLSGPAAVAAPGKATSIESLRAAVVQPPAARASAESADSSVELHIASVPSGARVMENDTLVGKTPLTLVRGRSDIARAPRRFILSSQGYLPFTLTQPMSNSDVSVTATLSAITPKPPAPIATERATRPMPAPPLDIRLQR
jgi:hypothetical protein